MEQILNSTTLYQDKYFVIKCDEVDLGNGNIIDYEYVDSIKSGMGALMVVPIDAEGYFYFVRMYQAGAKCHVTTFPKGGVEVGDNVLTRANLELQQEIGMRSKQLTELGELYSHPGRVARQHHIILAQELEYHHELGDEIETIEILRYTEDEIKTMIMSGQINDAKTIASFYMTLEYLSTK